MKKALEFLQDCGVFFLATTEGDQPRVRPFGAIFEYEGRLYSTTSNQKECYKQMLANPQIEISAMNNSRAWIRIQGEVVFDDSTETKAFALDTLSFLKSMYSLDDGVFTTFYIKNGTATIASFTDKPETFTF